VKSFSKAEVIMNKIRWRILGAICLLLSVMPMPAIKEAWASALQQLAPLSAQMQAVQPTVSLLMDDEEQTAFVPSNMQTIIQLLLQDDEQQLIFLPMVHR
jgi:hypothetical protein